MLSSHCKHGHAYTEQNTYIDKKNNRRQCKACNTNRHRINYKQNGNKNRPTNAGLVHGTLNGYSNYKCRCELCRESRRLWINKRYASDPDLKVRARERASKWYYANPDKVQAYKKENHAKRKVIKRDRNLKKNYGIGSIEYEKIFARQNQSCASCSRKWIVDTKRFAVDHDHKTGRVRGILCHNCNISLGLLKDDINNIINLMKYIKKGGL